MNKEIVYVDDPSFRVVKISDSDEVKFRFRRAEIPFTEDVKLSAVRSLLKTSKIKDYTRAAGIVIQDDWCEFDLNGNEYGVGSFYLIIDGYGNGNRIAIVKIIVTKSGL